MTSTNVNIGFSEGKNSSRVLKPPGGGHSDIFGVKDELQAPTHRKTHAPSSITGCFTQEVEKNENIKNGNEGKIDIIDENTEPAKDNKTKDMDLEKNGQNKPPTPPRRTRVPPGGFSSGLW